jgi:hypothetical protein
MTEQQIKDYLEKYSLTTKEKLAEHITQLKRNTKPNLELVSELNYVLVDEENLFFNVFSREKIVGDLEGMNKPPQKRLTLHIENVINDTQQEKKSAMFLDEVLAEKENKECSWTKCGQKNCVCCYPNSAKKIEPSEKQIDEINKMIEELNKKPSKNIMNILDKVIESSTQKQIKKENTKGHSTRLKANNPLIVSEKGEELVFDKDCNLKANTPMEEAPLGYFGKRGKVIDYSIGKKETQTVEKAPIFTYCKVNKNALEALALRALYGHKKYNIDGADEDWQNFTRVPNGDEEYANANFRHALNIGEETEEEHLISSAWNAVARLEIYLRNNNEQ